MWNGRAASKLFFHFQNRVNSPGHHRWRTFGHQSRNIPLLQEILDTAHWRSCSSWMCSHTARPRYHSPENNNAYSESLLFSAKKKAFTGFASSHEMVHSLTGIHPVSCSLGLHSARAPEGPWLGLPERSQTCRGSGPGLNTAWTHWKLRHSSTPAAHHIKRKEKKLYIQITYSTWNMLAGVNQF